MNMRHPLRFYQIDDMPPTPVADAVYFLKDADGRHASQAIVDELGNVRYVGRQFIQGDFDIYVSVTSGDDGNSGLSPTKAFKTLQRAWYYICDNLVLNLAHVRVNIADGFYENGASAYGQRALVTDGNYDYDRIPHPIGCGRISFIGNTSTLGNVIVDGQDERSDWASFELQAARGIEFTIKGVQLNSYSTIYGTVMVVDTVRMYGQWSSISSQMGGCAQFKWGATIQIVGDGKTNNSCYISAASFGFTQIASAINIVDAVNCPNGLIHVYKKGFVLLFNSMTGGANAGKKYLIDAQGLLDTAGNTIPGSAGIVNTGGQVI